MRKVITEMLKDDKISKKHRNRLSVLLLSFILKINGKINVNFEDFEDVMDFPLLAPFMSTF